MGTPYFKTGLVLGDRVPTTIGASYTTAPLQYNDKLDTTWALRDATEDPFTGAYEHDTQLTYGYHTSTRDHSLDNPQKVITRPSGRRTSSATRGSRETLSSTWTGLTETEIVMYTRFIQMVWGRLANDVVNFVDENDNVIPVRIESYSFTKDVSKNPARPYTIKVNYSLEHTSEKYTYRSGGQLVI